MLFPIALDLRGKRCVVVGGGAVGERKARALAAAGADVGVVSPEVTDGLSDFIHEGGAAHVNRTFLPQHLDGAFLVIAATDRPEVNAEVARAARARGLLVNLAAPAAAASAETGHEDGGETGDFVTMAAVRRGDLLLAVTAGGAGPALAARLKRELESRFGPEWAAYAALLREMRAAARREIPDRAARADALRRLAAADEIRAKLAAGDAAGARRDARALLLRETAA